MRLFGAILFGVLLFGVYLFGVYLFGVCSSTIRKEASPPEDDEAYLIVYYLAFVIYSSSSSFKPTASSASSSGQSSSTSAKGTGDRGTLLQLLPSGGGEPALRHFASGSTLIRAPCFCPRTGRLAWNELGKILIHEIEGL